MIARYQPHGRALLPWSRPKWRNHARPHPDNRSARPRGGRRSRPCARPRLGDGDLCSSRDGGAWGSLPGHPNLFGTYACAHDGAVWATSTAAHQGVNESNPVWTVRTAQFGHHTLVTRHVVKAWFVGTFFG